MTVVVQANLDALASQIREINEYNGWVTPEDDTVDHQIAVLMLVVTEICEAVEELRNGRGVTETYYLHGGAEVSESAAVMLREAGITPKPEGVPTEIADAIIRLLDFASARKIKLNPVVARKLEYNLTRGHRHGGKTI